MWDLMDMDSKARCGTMLCRFRLPVGLEVGRQEREPDAWSRGWLGTKRHLFLREDDYGDGSSGTDALR